MWVRGPGGEPREIYTVLADAEMTAGETHSVAPGEQACCTSQSASNEVASAGSACC